MRVAALVVIALTGCAGRHVTRGVVLRVDPSSATVTISHEAIPDYMDAMAMPFTARNAGELRGLEPGDRVQFRLVVRRKESYVDRLRVISADRVDTGLLESPAVPTLVPIGGQFPDFELVDQDEKRISLHSLRGQVVAVNFIYTRCPLPDYCPRMVNRFKSVTDTFGPRLGRDLTFLTISFDPKYDTPEMLRTYVEAFKVGGRGWHFLTGSVSDIERVCSAFGIEYWAEEGLVTHTLQTAVIDREGRLVAAIEGKDYTEKQLADLISTVLDPM